MSQYRILSLDGGGSWALIQVKVLIDLFSEAGDGTDVSGHEVLRHFDLAIGNSGGTITLGALLADMPLSMILHLLLDEKLRKSMFVESSFWKDPAAHLLRPVKIGPKYDTTAKLKGLKAIMGATGEILIEEVPRNIGLNHEERSVDVVFCAFDYDTNREVFFRSNANSQASARSASLKMTVTQAIHASSTAPVNYFDAPAQGTAGRRYWDGGVGGYNNPVLAGVIEAVANGIARENVWALSLGTANVVLPLQRHEPHEDPALVAHAGSSTIVHDLRKLALSIVGDPPDVASFHAHMMLECDLPSVGTPVVKNGRIVRMNPLIQPLPGRKPIPWVLPQGLSKDEFERLVNLDMDAIEQDQVLLIVKLCDCWLRGDVPNQGIRVNRDTLVPDIGHARYQEAKDFWLHSCPRLDPDISISVGHSLRKG